MDIVLGPLAADLILVLGIGAILATDLVLPPGDKRLLGWGALYALMAALLATFAMDLSGPAVNGAYAGDSVALLFKRIFYTCGTLGALGALAVQGDRFTRRQGEYWILLLSSVLGMSLMAGARDLLLMVVSFELMSIPLFVMAAWAREDRLSVEGALKLFIIGAASSVALMFGVSLITGMVGSTEIAAVSAYAAEHRSPLLLLGGAMTLGGMGYKLGVFPFHMWVPDTYQGSSTPFVAFLSVAPKAAAVVALVRILVSDNGAMLDHVRPMIVTLAAATLVMGNLLALHQSQVKRLLAYSGVAHIGFVLMALATGTPFGLSMLLFYLLAYLFTNMGAFFVIHAVAGDIGDDMSVFDGLFARNGWLAMAMLLFLLSLAGIPFASGFWAKLFVFLAAWAEGMQWLVLLGALLSVVSLFYYLRVVQAMFMRPPPGGAEPVVPDWGTNAAIVVCLLFVVGMGVLPGPFVEVSTQSAHGMAPYRRPVATVVPSPAPAPAEAVAPAEAAPSPTPTAPPKPVPADAPGLVEVPDPEPDPDPEPEPASDPAPSDIEPVAEPVDPVAPAPALAPVVEDAPPPAAVDAVPSEVAPSPVPVTAPSPAPEPQEEAEIPPQDAP